MATHQSTTPTRPIRARAHEILAGAAAAFQDDPPCPLFIRAGNTFHEASESVVIDCARRLARARFTTGAPVLRNTEALHSFLIAQLGSRDEEVFAAILLDTHRRLIEYVELFHGALDGAPVYVREVVKYVAATRAAEVIIVHNHPSGDATPSLPDLAVTARIRESLRLIDVKLLDHLIVGASITSLKERGLLR